MPLISVWNQLFQYRNPIASSIKFENILFYISYVNPIHGLDIRMAAPNIEDCACLVSMKYNYIHCQCRNNNRTNKDNYLILIFMKSHEKYILKLERVKKVRED